MRAYARDLRRGDRRAIAKRYSGLGAFLIREGRSRYLTARQIEARYASVAWHPPSSFKWLGLHYECMSAKLVRVTGAFEFGRLDGAKKIAIYGGVLELDESDVRLLVEDESLQNGYAR